MNFLGFFLGAAAALAIVRLFRKPVEFLLKIAVNSVLGGVFLVLLNTLLSALSLPGVSVNVVTAAVSGFLGLPGVAALYILTLFVQNF